MYLEVDAKKLRCPYVDKKCETTECMAWNWISQYGDIRYENVNLLSDSDRAKLLAEGWQELPAHGYGLALKQLFPMTPDEVQKLGSDGNRFGTQLFFGMPTDDQTKWLGQCSCLNPGVSE